MQMQTCPSILEFKAEEYIHQIERLSPYFQYFQIDLADGILVDNKTATLDDITDEFKKWSFSTSSNNKYSSPDHKYSSSARLPARQGVEKMVFDFHLMVKDYETEIKKLDALKNIINIKNVFVHFSVVNNFAFDVLSFSPYPVGLTLNPDETVENLAAKFNLENIPFLQIMSVVPGAQGKPFEPGVLNKIEQLRLLNYRKEIFLDGAVNDKTLPVINSLKFKPDFICPGSFLTKCPDNKLKERTDYLLEFNH